MMIMKAKFLLKAVLVWCMAFGMTVFPATGSLFSDDSSNGSLSDSGSGSNVRQSGKMSRTFQGPAGQAGSAFIGGGTGEIAAEKPLQGKTVLLVDDSILNIKIGKRLLNVLGLSVTTALSGQKAITKLEERQHQQANFEVVLMDIQMPEMNGLEASRALRAKRYAGPIIAFTSDPESDARVVTGFAEGIFQGYLHKPVKIDALEAKILEVLGSQQHDIE